MITYILKNGGMVECPDGNGAYIKYSDHNDYFITRWKHINAENKKQIKKQHQDAILITKLKLLSLVLTISLLILWVL